MSGPPIQGKLISIAKGKACLFLFILFDPGSKRIAGGSKSLGYAGPRLPRFN